MPAEPQYAACFEEPPVTLGPMIGSTFRWNPVRLLFVAARYKWVAKMLAGSKDVAEIGCADGFMSRIVAQTVTNLSLFDFDPKFVAAAREGASDFALALECRDIVGARLPRGYNAIYMIDTLEHITPEDEPAAMKNIVSSLYDDGVFIAGIPSIESQAHASPISKAGHVNCKTGDDLKATMLKYFRNVFLFSMNDEIVHTGFAPMAHYLFVLCCSPIRTLAEIQPSFRGHGTLGSVPLWNGIPFHMTEKEWDASVERARDDVNNGNTDG